MLKIFNLDWIKLQQNPNISAYYTRNMFFSGISLPKVSGQYYTQMCVIYDWLLSVIQMKMF